MKTFKIGLQVFCDTSILLFIYLTRDSPDCHMVIPYNPSKSYLLAVLVILTVSPVMPLKAVFAGLAVWAQMAELARSARLSVLDVFAVLDMGIYRYNQPREH